MLTAESTKQIPSFRRKPLGITGNFPSFRHKPLTLTTPRSSALPTQTTSTTPSVPQGIHTSRNLPERGSLCPSDFQNVVPILQLEIHENQGNGVPGLGQDSPGAVCIVAILQGEVGAGDDPALAPQGPSAGVVGCNTTQGVSPELPKDRAQTQSQTPPCSGHGGFAARS